MRSLLASRRLGIPILALLLWGAGMVSLAEAQTPPGKKAESVFLLPFVLDVDRGAANGDAVIGSILPVNSVLITERWKLVNVALITIASAPGGIPGMPGNPEPVPGPRTFGLGDFSDALLYAPIKPTGLQWGVGLFLGFPTAVDETLGSGKWQAGPAVRLGYQTGPWRFELLAGTRWSFAGDEERAAVSQLMARALARRTLPGRWFFVSSPSITANWRAESSQRWVLPLGGGLGYSFDLRGTPLNVSLQAYVNALKPDGAPNSVYRLEVVLPVRVPERR